MMRTHEGNRPAIPGSSRRRGNYCPLLPRMTVFHVLKPKPGQAVAQNAATGLPVMRPLFLHYENDAATHTLKYHDLRSSDLAGRAGSRAGRRHSDAVPAGHHWVNIGPAKPPRR